MKAISRILILLAAAGSLLCSCTKDHSYEDNTEPELQLYQIAGTWRLSSWNGTALGDETYCYLVLKSKDTAFDIYQNLDSPYSRHFTGTFSLLYDEDKGNTIRGRYDYNAGLWKSDYTITGVTSDSMTWTSTDGEISVYTRCDSVPDEIIVGTKSL